MPEYTQLEIQQITQAQVHAHLRMKARLAEQRQQAQAMRPEPAASPFSVQYQADPLPQVLVNPFSFGGAAKVASTPQHKQTDGSLLPVFLVLLVLVAVIWKMLKWMWD